MVNDSVHNRYLRPIVPFTDVRSAVPVTRCTTDNRGVKGQSIRIAIADAALGRALLGRIARAMHETPVTAEGMFDSLVPGDVLITTPNDCSAVECHYLSQLGMRVIVLAPVIREFDRARYLEAGAVAYIPMLLDTADLVAAIHNATSEQSAQMPMVPIRPTCHANPM